jgi:WD40 repeat protein
LKGKLISSFNEHQSSVHNLHIFDGTLVSASSENVLKLWPVYQLDCFRSIKSSASIKYQSSVNSLGSCGDLFFVSCEQGVDLYSNLDFQNPSRIPDQDLSKTIRLSDQTLSSINQKGKLSIYDTRTLSSIQSYKFPFYGPLSNLCQGPHENILCLSTYIGAIILYDIRFACPASTLYHSSGLPIFALHSYDSRSLLVGSEDISILDVYSNGVTSLLSSSNDSPRIPAFCESIERDWLVHSCFDIGKRMQKVFESPGTVRKIISPGKPFVISAGNDALVKVWNIEKPKESCFIGQNRKKGADDIGEHNYGDVKIIQQKVDRVTTNQMILPGNSMKRKNYDGCPDHRSRSHNDAILDIVMHSSCPYLISSSRDGSIKVWN